MHCPKTHVLAAHINKPMSMHVFHLLQTKSLYMFWSCFELLILVGLQQTTELSSLMPIFAGNASLYRHCMF